MYEMPLNGLYNIKVTMLKIEGNYVTEEISNWYKKEENSYLYWK